MVSCVIFPCFFQRNLTNNFGGQNMSLVSNLFILFVLSALLVYYLVPKKAQWAVLLAFSYIYYLAGGIRYIVFLLFSTLVTYGAARGIAVMQSKEGKGKGARRLLIAGLILNFGMLGVLKYTNFAIENINALFHMNLRGREIILALGISFYTFQSCGYMLDVYWKRCEAEKNPFKYALFVSFFPQLLQGPIGRYSTLAKQLYEAHAFEMKNITRGFERILWGFFKKMIIADWAAVFVDEIFDTQQYSGLALIGLLLYSLQLYADFSGGMDVVIGIAQMFGITLDENFKRPFFAVSLTDFWHRWHITLGTWMKDYVFYPVTLSKWMGKFGKWARKVCGKKYGRALPICLANVVVFLIVGIWHGAAWKYIVYGLYNGIIIGFSGLMTSNYKSWKKALHITGKEKWYYVFTVARTFVLVNISMYLDRVDTVGQALHMLKQAFTKFTPSELLLIPAGRGGTAFTPYALMILAAGFLILVVVGVLQERGVKIRESLAKLPLPVTAAVYFCLLLSMGLFGSTAVARGFIYAQF